MASQRTGELTPRQRKVYEFIRSKIHDRGYGPTVRETAAAFGIRSPNGVMCHLRALEKKNLIRREKNMSRAIQLTERSRGTSLPLAGVISAGSPLEAIEQTEQIDFGDMFSSQDLFVLRVQGESMIEDQIADGDYVVVRKATSASDGQIVVAMVDGEDATLKRFYREPDRIRLEPANRTMQPIFADEVNVMGIVVGVVRKY